MTSPGVNKPASDRSADENLMTQQRRDKIVELVQSQGSARVTELADRFQVSEVTIRADLVRLEKDGLLNRGRGGALAKTFGTPVTSLLRVEQRAGLNLEQKRRIAHAAAAMVSPGDTIIMDAGTTAVEMVGPLTAIKPLTVVTNALNVALELGARSDAHVILLGGTLNRDSSSTLGPIAEHNLDQLVVQKLFLGTQAMNLEHGLTDSTIEIAQAKRAMMRNARQVILLTDASKWDKVGFTKVAPLAEIDTIICDEGLPEDARAAIQHLGVDLVLV